MFTSDCEDLENLSDSVFFVKRFKHQEFSQRATLSFPRGDGSLQLFHLLRPHRGEGLVDANHEQDAKENMEETSFEEEKRNTFWSVVTIYIGTTKHIDHNCTFRLNKHSPFRSNAHKCCQRLRAFGERFWSDESEDTISEEGLGNDTVLHLKGQTPSKIHMDHTSANNHTT